MLQILTTRRSPLILLISVNLVKTDAPHWCVVSTFDCALIVILDSYLDAMFPSFSLLQNRFLSPEGGTSPFSTHLSRRKVSEFVTKY